jgi:hypothetical protein
MVFISRGGFAIGGSRLRALFSIIFKKRCCHALL